MANFSFVCVFGMIDGDKIVADDNVVYPLSYKPAIQFEKPHFFSLHRVNDTQWEIVNVLL